MNFMISSCERKNNFTSNFSPIGLPAVLETTKKLSVNLTCTATISLNGIELLRYISGGGTTSEVF